MKAVVSGRSHIVSIAVTLLTANLVLSIGAARAAPPAVDNSSGATVSVGSAILPGNLTADGTADVYTYWGRTDGGTNALNWECVVTNGTMAAGAFSSVVSNLYYGLPYYYTTYATNADGEAWAPSTLQFSPVNPLWDGNWLKISFTNHTFGTLTNFPVLVKLSTGISNFTYSSFLSTNGYDLRFWDAAKSTNLNYEIDQWNTNGESLVWVQVPMLTRDCHIWASWGNAADSNQVACTTNGATWSDSFEAVWHLKETGPSYADSVLKHNANTNATPPLTAPGQTPGGIVGAGQVFDGIKSLTAGTIDVGDLCTFTAWVNVTNTASNYQTVLGSKPGGGTSDGFAWIVNKYGKADKALVLETGNGGSGSKASTPGGLVTYSVWHHVAGVVDRLGGTARFYVDGADQTGNSKVTAFGKNKAVYIGQFAPGGVLYCFSGILDEIRIGTVARSADWIKAEYLTVASHATFTTYHEVRCGGRIDAIVNLAATNVTANSATLQGIVNSSGAVYNVSLYWGPGDGMTAAGAWANTNWIGAYTNEPPIDLSRVIPGGLIPGTAYYYAFMGSNAVTNLWAQPSAVFYTLGAPVVNNGSGATPGLGFATLNGNLLSTGGAETAVYTYWGETNGGTDKLAWEQVITNGVLDVGMFSSNTPSTLLYGGLYYYRTYATNGHGEAWAADTASFITLPPTMQSITNMPASGYAVTSAVLHATLACTQAVCDVYAYWNTVNGGTNASLWTNSAYVGSWTNVASTNLSYRVTELASNALYYFAFRATNAAADLWATNVLSFPHREKDILTFGLGGVPAVISGTNISWIVPYAADVAALAPVYTVSDIAVGDPPSGSTNDFSSPRVYTVTAEDFSTKDYTITVTKGVRPTTFFWTNTVSGAWSSLDNWTNETGVAGAPVAGGVADYSIYFNRAGTYVATNDLPDGFLLNRLSFGGATVTLAGNSLTFTNNLGLPPLVSQSSTRAILTLNRLKLATGVTFGGGGNGGVTLAGTVSGTGSLTKTNSGTLTLTGANTYTGATRVEAGILSLSKACLADFAAVYVAAGAKLNLNFIDVDVINRLYFNNAPQAFGTWGATGSGAENINDTYLSGSGMLWRRPPPTGAIINIR